MEDAPSARCVYVSGAAACRRAVVAYCPSARLLFYATAGRVLAYCPQAGRVVGLSEDRSEGDIVGLRLVSGRCLTNDLTALLSLHTSGAVAVWHLSKPCVDNAYVDHVLHRALHLLGHHKGSISSGDACYLDSCSGSRLLIVTAGTDHALNFVTACSTSGNVLSSSSVKLPGRSLVPELRLVPLPSAAATPMPLLLCGGDDSKVHVWASHIGQLVGDGSEDLQYKRVGALPGHRDWITALDFVYVGGTVMLASGSKDGGVRVWRLRLDQPSAPDSGSGSVALSENGCNGTARPDDGDTLIADTDCGVETLKVRPVPLGALGTATLETVLSCHEGAVARLCWLQLPGLQECNLRLLSCTQTEDRSIVMWQPQSYRHIASSDATEGDDNDGDVWVEAARLGEVGGNREGFFSAVFSWDGSAVYAHSYQGGIHEWRLEGDNFWVPQPTVAGHFRPVVDCAWEPKGRYLLTCSEDQTTRLHAKTTDGAWHEVCRPQVHGYDMSCVACLPGLSFVSGAEEKVLRAFSAPTILAEKLATSCGWEPLLELESRDFVDAAAVPSLGLSNKSLSEQNQPRPQQQTESSRPTEDTLMAGTLWPEVAKLYGHGHELMAVAATARHIATSCKAATPQDAAIIVWSAKSYQQLQELHYHRLTVTQLNFSSDGSKLLAVSRDRSWSIYDGQLSDEFTLSFHSGLLEKSVQHSRIIWASSWAPGDTAFVTASRDKTIAVWQASGDRARDQSCGTLLWRRANTLREEDEVSAVAVTATHRQTEWLIATGLVNGDVKLHEYNEQRNELIATTTLTPAHHATVRRLSFCPPKEGNSILAACGNDNLVFLYICHTSQK
ncbi:elongator complex protein 2 [Hyalella azteca]|uniref:Elongator complex protein 2 n=1 Tax=Hyalella azteca TaxID=294128 RepID=A0A8B7NVB6_HYAAZ|nr:elongator complex protein 2 [Hyalella azteca]